MAYLDLEIGIGAGIMSTPTVPVSLEPLERQAIAVSRGDGMRSIRTRRSTDWLLNLVYGVEPVRSLADEKLEALRRYAVVRRIRGDQMEPHETDRAMAASFPAAKLALVHKMVDPWRLPAPEYAMARQILLVIALVALGALLFPWIEEGVGDPLIAGLLLGVALVISLPALLSTDPRP